MHLLVSCLGLSLITIAGGIALGAWLGWWAMTTLLWIGTMVLSLAGVYIISIVYRTPKDDDDYDDQLGI